MKRQNESGQSIVEAVLLMFVFLIIATLVSSQLKENGIAARLIQTPWEKLDNMIRYGTWTTENPEEHHPAHSEKHSTSIPN